MCRRVIFIKGNKYGYFKSIDKAYFYGSLELITVKDIKQAKVFYEGDGECMKRILDIMKTNELEVEIIKLKELKKDGEI